MQKLEFHPLAEVFPLMEGQSFLDLVANISSYGLIEPITLYEGMILDGRNRYRACLEANAVLDFDQYAGDDPMAFVLSKNLQRRHLNESQRAMVAARIATMRQGERTDLGQSCTMSQPEAADALNISTRSVKSAKATLDNGTPKLIAAVEQGEIPVSQAAAISKLEPEEQQMVLEQVAAGVSPREARRRAKQPPAQVSLPPGEYNVLLADPPWKYDFSETTTREIENQYPTMSLGDIMALAIPAAENSVLFLWATAPKLKEALAVIDAWNFTYKTHAVWDKELIGMGYWVRGQHELLLIATKGHFSPPEPANRPSSVIRQTRTGHSEKPDLVYSLIERMFPHGQYLELFARNTRENWASWGNECQ